MEILWYHVKGPSSNQRSNRKPSLYLFSRVRVHTTQCALVLSFLDFLVSHAPEIRETNATSKLPHVLPLFLPLAQLSLQNHDPRIERLEPRDHHPDVWLPQSFRWHRCSKNADDHHLELLPGRQQMCDLLSENNIIVFVRAHPSGQLQMSQIGYILQRCNYGQWRLPSITGFTDPKMSKRIRKIGG